MDFSFSPEEQKFRDEFVRFIEAELANEDGPPYDEFGHCNWGRVLEVRRRLAEKGYLTCSWPRQYGGMGASPILHTIFHEEMAKHRAPGVDMVGVEMIGPGLIKFGAPWQQQEFLPRMAKGDLQWCQGFSEPNAGSDLASLSTRAHLDGDDFVINGTKIWMSEAAVAEWLYILVRTDPDVPKHRGLSLLLVDMSTPGIEIRPLFNMAGFHRFNQVEFNDVRTPRRCLVGELNGGWPIAVDLLNQERSSVYYVGWSAGILDEVVDYWRTEKTTRDGPLEEGIRLSIAERYIESEIARLLAYNVAWKETVGIPDVGDSTLVKILGTELQQGVAALGMKVLGLFGQLNTESKWVKLEGDIRNVYLTFSAATIGGGASEILRSLVARKGLGLPRGD